MSRDADRLRRSDVMSRHVLNAGSLLKESRVAVLEPASAFTVADGHGGRYSHRMGRQAREVLALARSLPVDADAPSPLFQRALAEWDRADAAPGGLALHDRACGILGVAPPQRVVEIDPDAVATYPTRLRRVTRCDAVESALDWLVGDRTVLTLDPYLCDGPRTRAVIEAHGTERDRADLDAALPVEAVQAALARLCGGDGVAIVFTTSLGPAVREPVEDLAEALAGFDGASGLLVADPPASPNRVFAMGLFGHGEGAGIVEDVLGMNWSTSSFVVRLGLAAVTVRSVR